MIFRKQYWVWLSLAFNSTGSVLSDKLLYEYRNDPEAIYSADAEELSRLLPGNDRLIRRLLNKDLNPVAAILNYCEKKNIGILTPDSFLYPTSLHSISSKPIVLYYKGAIPEFSERLSISVVGTRKASGYGSNSAYTISYDLAKNGAIVVSGMAEGIDGIAHRGALDALGKTVAVLGSGIDVIYPKCNSDLYDELILRGLVLTEYAPGTPPNGWHFPQRNRIISALSDGLLVVEATERSGSLITAEYAEEQGKLLYAVPGMIGEYTSIGTNALIKNGAKITSCANDIIADFKSLYANTLYDPREYVENAKPEFRIACPPYHSRRSRKKIDIPESDYRNMSFESDPKLKETLEDTIEHNRRAASLQLEYPEEKLTKSGYEAPRFWELKSGAMRLPRFNKLQGKYETPYNEAEEPISDFERDAINPRRSQSKQSNKNHADKKITPALQEIPVELNENERGIVELISQKGKATADDMAKLGIPIHVLLSTMTVLEIRGIIKQHPGGYYTLK